MFMHDNHVTKHNVACFHCHQEIKHGYRVAVKEKKEVLFECSLCHIDKHSAHKEIYAGKGGIGVENEMPSPMFLSNVDCVGCHNDVKEEKFNGKTFFASEKACLRCHGNKYKGIVDNAKKEINETISLIKEKLENTKKQMNKFSASEKMILDKVEHNIKFIETAHGVHNIYYTAQLLAKSNEMLNELKSNTKLNLKDLSGNSIISGKFCATMCHQKVDIKVPVDTIKYKGKDMPHNKHFEELDINCVVCHEFAEHKKVKLRKELPCNDCHN
jgi:hypothetical protein